MTKSSFWTMLLVLVLFIGSCLAMTGCGRNRKEVYDEPIGPSVTSWDNGSVTYWENLETEEILTENIEVEDIIVNGIVVNEITVE